MPEDTTVPAANQSLLVQSSFPHIDGCTKRELYVHVLCELINLYTAAERPVNQDVLLRLAKLAGYD